MQASTKYLENRECIGLFQSTRLLQASTASNHPIRHICNHFNPRGSCKPRLIIFAATSCRSFNFNPRGSCKPRPVACKTIGKTVVFQSTRLLQASTLPLHTQYMTPCISIHEALASLDILLPLFRQSHIYFNPRGSCKPRQ